MTSEQELRTLRDRLQEELHALNIKICELDGSTWCIVCHKPCHEWGNEGATPKSPTAWLYASSMSRVHTKNCLKCVQCGMGLLMLRTSVYEKRLYCTKCLRRLWKKNPTLRFEDDSDDSERYDHLWWLCYSDSDEE